MEQALTNLFIAVLGGLGVLLVTVMQVQAARFKQRLVKENKVFDQKIADEQTSRQAEIARLQAEISQKNATTESLKGFAASNHELIETVCKLVETLAARDGVFVGEIRANSTAIGGLAEDQNEMRATIEHLAKEMGDAVAIMKRYLEDGAKTRTAIEETRSAAQAAREAAEATLARLKDKPA